MLGVFVGTELQHLIRVAKGSADEGPGCYESGTRYTFWAESGHSYDIGADGFGYAPPMQEPPPKEGTISLSIEATPPPPNDHFADAIPIEGPYGNTGPNSITEPGGPRRLTKQVFGYNWGATAEFGEPEHAGVPGGASVWYRWTPPASGEARLDLQYPGGPSLLALYTGTAITGLTTLGSDDGADRTAPCPRRRRDRISDRGRWRERGRRSGHGCDQARCRCGPGGGRLDAACLLGRIDAERLLAKPPTEGPATPRRRRRRRSSDSRQ